MKPPTRRFLLFLLFFFSGAAGLGYQMVWLRVFTAGLGHEVPALLGVVAAFLGGMALGAGTLSKAIGGSQRPAHWYAGLEMLIGLWGAGSAVLIPIATELALRWNGPSPSPLAQWLGVFSFPLLTLLPGTAAMGATLPAMERLLSRLSRQGKCVGALYSANTLGATAGVLSGTFLLMPALGFRLSLLTLGLVSVVCGLIAWFVGSVPVVSEANSSAKPAGFAPELSRRRLFTTVLATGLLGIGFQLVGIRLLSQVLENTVYSYAASLAVYLIGTAAGAAIYQRWIGRSGGLDGNDRKDGGVQGGRGVTSGSSMLAAWLWAAAGSCLLAAPIARGLHPFYDACRDWLGNRSAAVLVSELSVAGLVFGLPTVVMGGLFSHLMQTTASGLGTLGRAVALNTIGCALALPLVGLWLLPVLGTKWSVVSIAFGYLAFLPRLRGWSWAMLAVLLACLPLLPKDLRIVDLAPGAQVTAYREGVMGAVVVVQTTDGHRSLRVNNRLQMGGTAAAIPERRQAHLPLLLHPHPQRALFLGPGTGITLGAAAVYPELRIEGVELVPEIVELMAAFEPENGGPWKRTNLHLSVADARRFVRTTTQRYDVIVADLFHPAQDGAGFLYTREHFSSVRRCLNPGGLFCQWLPLHQLDEKVLRSVIRTFLESFPSARAVWLHFNVDIPVLGLVGSAESGPSPIAPGKMEQRLSQSVLRESLRAVGLDKAINVLGCLAADSDSLRRYAQTAPLNTDDLPLVLFEAPHHSARRDTRPEETLLAFLGQATINLDGVVARSPDEATSAFATPLAQFIAARDLYFKGLVKEASGRLKEAIDLYLESTRRSLHFTPAYARCVGIIQVLAATDRGQAEELFRRLEVAQPAQPLGRKLLGPLFQNEPVP